MIRKRYARLLDDERLQNSLSFSHLLKAKIALIRQCRQRYVTSSPASSNKDKKNYKFEYFSLRKQEMEIFVRRGIIG